MDILKIVRHAWLGVSSEIAESAVEMDQRLVQIIEALQDVESLDWDEHGGSFEMFGTSGIRGVYCDDLESNPSEDFLAFNRISPKFAYYAGLATAIIAREDYGIESVWVVMDSRRSSLLLTIPLIRGLTDGRLSVAFGGIAPTPSYTLNPKGMCLVVTASHNPVKYNGIKVFYGARPLNRELEIKLACILNHLSRLEARGLRWKHPEGPGNVAVSVLEFERRHFSSMYNLYEMVRLRVEYGNRLEKRFLPLDLAYGSAGCAVNEQDRITRLSPCVAVLLSLGIPVIGYGLTRHPDKMNHRIGAAYAYGETECTLLPGEMARFARGMPGYGAGARRIAVLPPGFGAATENLAHFFQEDCTEESMQHILIGFPEFNSHAFIVYMDEPDADQDLISALDSEIMNRTPLPGLMVDGDADRILVTAPMIAKNDEPFVSGDAMIRLFAEMSGDQRYDEVIFTLESGLSVEKALEKLYELSPSDPNYRAVTVGDRAIIDYFHHRRSGKLLGGEPSGHLIFGIDRENQMTILDDPFITYLKLLDILAAERFDLDRTLSRMNRDIPEVYCARKPDSWAGVPHGSGITLNQKKSLELWDHEEPKFISEYARKFIPEYIGMYGKMYSRAFWANVTPDISMTWEWREVSENRMTVQYLQEWLTVAKIRFDNQESQEELEVLLNIDQREWAGPEVIWITFWRLANGKITQKVGEGVFRNSGTSPKNAGYHKLWPEHPFRQDLSEGCLKELLDDLAVKRAVWTDQYIEQHLKEE